MSSTWANTEKVGVIIFANGVSKYIDRGDEYQILVNSGPLPWMPPVIDFDYPEQQEVLAATDRNGDLIK